MTVAVGGDEGTLTPYTCTTGYPGYNLMALVFDTLLVLDPGNQIRPLLATGLTTNADSTVFTLPLRAGVTWHDGKRSPPTTWCSPWTTTASTTPPGSPGRWPP